MADTFTSLNNAIVRGAYLMHDSPDWQQLNDDWQTNVVGRRDVLIAVPPLWADVLQGHWLAYRALYLDVAPAIQKQLPDPAAFRPEGVSEATAELYAPAKSLLQKTANQAVADLTKTVTKTASDGSTAWLWGVGTLVAVAVIGYYELFGKKLWTRSS